jgi:plasmid stabilization system protein ParE
MLPVVWLDSAVEDLQSIVGFIAEANPQAASKLAGQVIEMPTTLAFYPRSIGAVVWPVRMNS